MKNILLILLFPLFGWSQAGPPNSGFVEVATISTDYNLATIGWGNTTGMLISDVVVNEGDDIRITINFSLIVTGSSAGPLFRIKRGSTVIIEKPSYINSSVDPTIFTLIWVDEDVTAGTYDYQLQHNAASGFIQGAGTDEHPFIMVEKI